MDRQALSKALAKAIAYKAAGKDAEADHWGRALIELLRDYHVVRGLQAPRRSALANPLT